MKKPILLLDVDGVINVIKEDITPIRLPVGRVIQTECLINFCEDEPEEKPSKERTVSFWPNPLWKKLITWADKNTELWWCTAWFDRANSIGKHAGITICPWISSVESVKWEDWKLTNVKSVFSNDSRRIIWIEDGFQHETIAWAFARPDTHLISTNFKIGLTKEILDKVFALA